MTEQLKNNKPSAVRYLSKYRTSHPQTYSQSQSRETVYLSTHVYELSVKAEVSGAYYSGTVHFSYKCDTLDEKISLFFLSSLNIIKQQHYMQIPSLRLIRLISLKVFKNIVLF